MGRYGRTLALIAVIVVLVALILGFQKISLGEFQRGGDTPLGLSLGLDLQGGCHLVFQANLTDPETGERVEVSEDQMEALQRTIDRRVNNSGLGEPIIQLLGSDRLLIQLPDVGSCAEAVDIIGETARLEFKRREYLAPREADEITTADIVSVTVDYLPGPQVTESEAQAEAEGESEADTGPAPEEVEEAEAEPDAQNTDQVAALIVEFTDEGAAEFQTMLAQAAFDFLVGQQAYQAGVTGTTIPGSVEVVVEGVEQQRLSILPGNITQIATSTSYGLVFPVEGADTEQPPIDVLRDRVGTAATVKFSQILWFVDEDTGLTGDDLARAFPGQHAASQRPIVNLEFNDRGTRIFGELTTNIYARNQLAGVPDEIAVFLDGNELVSPRVESPITTGTGFIQGADFTIERVREIALLLESGRLPVPIELIQEREVDAILGADSLAKSVVAGLVGLGLVLLFMTFYYRLPGLIASIALIIYASLVLAVFKILPVTLTLSGVAAVILSIGMAVDANILIFERMKDELRAGRTLLMSINIGFDRAWPAIRDGNVSTLITCAILFWFADQLAASIVQGFAVTLAIGVAISMFTAITISRTLLRVIATTRITRSNRLWLPYAGTGVGQPAGD